MSPDALSLRSLYEHAGLPFEYRGQKLGDVPASSLAAAARVEKEGSIASKVPAGEWVSHKKTPTLLEGALPTFADEVLESYMSWQEVGQAGQAVPRLNKLGLAKGWKMLKEKPSVLANLQVFSRPVDLSKDRVPAQTLADGETDQRRVFFATTLVPPTMKAGHYTVYTELLTEPSERAGERHVTLTRLGGLKTAKTPDHIIGDTTKKLSRGSIFNRNPRNPILTMNFRLFTF